MKISKESMEVLKNFAATNMSLIIQPGSVQKTLTPQKNVMAIAKLAESFPEKAPIYDLNQFLATASLFDDPDFEFGETSVTISDQSGASVKYVYAAESTIPPLPTKNIVLPSVDVSFTLNAKEFSSALKAAAVMGLPNVTITGEDGDVFLGAADAANDSNHAWRKRVGASDVNFNVIFLLDLLKFLPRDYDVELSSKLISKFTSKKDDVTYFIAAETGSKFQ